MGNKFFSRHEAESKIGKRVRLASEWCGIKPGLTGTVVEADFSGYIRLINETVKGYDVGVQWDGRKRNSQGFCDWFSRQDYEDYLIEE